MKFEIGQEFYIGSIPIQRKIKIVRFSEGTRMFPCAIVRYLGNDRRDVFEITLEAIKGWQDENNSHSKSK